jgi:predicted nucleic acid-binding protein
MAVYLDTSALVKLIAEEEESDDLLDFVGDDEIVSSLLARTELVRAVARKHERFIEAAEALLSDLSYVAVNRVVTGAAAWVQPWTLRSLDAIHVSSAVRMGAGLRAVVTYDDRMVAVARSAGLDVASPGRTVL